MVLAHSRALKTGGNTVVIRRTCGSRRRSWIIPARGNYRFQPAAGRAAGGRAAFHRRRKRPVRDCRRHPDALPPGSYLVLSHVTGESAASRLPRQLFTTRRWRQGRRCAGGKRSSSSSLGWNSSNPAWSRYLAGVLTSLNRRMPRRCGFWVQSGTGPARLECDWVDARSPGSDPLVRSAAARFYAGSAATDRNRRVSVAVVDEQDSNRIR